MSEIIFKAQRSAAILAEKALKPCRRAWQGLEALSGLAISDLSESAREVVETELAWINQIISDYDIETDEDWEGIEGVDIAEILQRIETVTNALIDFETQRVMSGLRQATDRIPKLEIEEVRRHRDLLVPLLIDEIELAVASARAGREPNGNAHFFAAFLLTELEVDSAFPILLEGFTLPGKGDFRLFGDAVHELLPQALALFSPNRTDTIDEILRDTSLDFYVRWAAASSYIYLVRDGGIDRDTAVANLHQHLKEQMSEDHEMIAPIICTLADLAAEEALGTIEEAYERDLVDTFIVDLESVQAEIADGEKTLEKALKRCRPTGMPDTIEELSHWGSFREEPPRPAENPAPRNRVPKPKSLTGDSSRPEPVATIRTDRTRVGRNDPCPCGSGKKFKKCCR